MSGALPGPGAGPGPERPTLLVVGVKQETATFNPARTTLDDFEVVRGSAAVAALRATPTEVGGVLDGAEALGFDVRVGTVAWALSGGPVTASAWAQLRRAVLDDVAAAGDVAGLVVVLHGSMVAEGDDDPDGSLLAAVRRLAGERPVVATLDLHAVVTAPMLAAADVLVPFHTYPHTDQHGTGVRAAGVLARLVSEPVVPTTAVVRVPLLARGDELLTATGLLGRLVERCRAVEAGPGGLSAGVFVGNPFTDVADLASVVLVATDGDPGRAATVAEEVAAELWAARDRLRAALVPVDEAVAASAGPGLTVLADQADATSSGAPGDAVTVLRALVAGAGGRPALVPLVDAPAAGAALALGPGRRGPFSLGGSVDARHRPLAVEAEVVSVHPDSTFTYEDGTVGRAGDSAVLRVDGVDVLVTSRPVWFVGRQVFVAHGLDPAAAAVVVVKSPNGFRPHYEALASAVVAVDGEGATSAALDRLPYRHVRRPIAPLDPVGAPRLRAERWTGRARRP